MLQALPHEPVEPIAIDKKSASLKTYTPMMRGLLVVYIQLLL